jgi:hypothetical protein
MIKTPLSLTIAAAFGLGAWLILPHSIKCLAELFQLLLLCHICLIAGRLSAVQWLIGGYIELFKGVRICDYDQ